jgi:hypothetical protein
MTAFGTGKIGQERPVADSPRSRVNCALVLPDEQGDSATAFLPATVTYSAAPGVTVREVLT